MHLDESQYAFANQTDTFDANLTIANEYCASLNSNAVANESTVAPLINTLASAYNEANETSPTTNFSNDCITYGDVVFVPTITHAQDNQQNPSKIEYDPTQAYTFLPASHIDGSASAALCEPSTQAFNEVAIQSADSSHFDQQPIYQIVDSNHVNVNIELQHGVQQQEVLLQDENGQLYRTVQNIFVDGTSMCSNDLVPIISPIDAEPNTEYNGDRMHLQAMQNTYGQTNRPDQPSPYEIPVNFISPPDSNETTSDAIGASAELQQVQFIFDSLGHSNAINGISQSNAMSTDQFQPIDSNAGQQTYQPQFELQSNKEQQSFLESTMSTLRECAIF